MNSYLLKKKKEKKREGGQKDMSKKLVSKSDVVSSFGVIYPYVSKDLFKRTHKTFSN